METIVKHFNDLTLEELWDIYRLRNSVFIVEQNCPYQDVDEWDKIAYHVFLRDEGGMWAYSRVLPEKTVLEDVSIGRVISAKRRCGLGSVVVNTAINVAKEKFFAKRITVGAQTYACPFYESVGFVRTTNEYVEDGIPHVLMYLDVAD